MFLVMQVSQIPKFPMHRPNANRAGHRRSVAGGADANYRGGGYVSIFGGTDFLPLGIFGSFSAVETT